MAKKRKKSRNIVLFAIVLFLVAGLALVPRLLYPLSYRVEIETAAGEYGVPTSLIAAVIKAESGFRPGVVSEKKAYGLMQVTEPTAGWIESQNEWEADLPDALLEPETSIQYGVWYLSYLTDKYDHEELALIAYNAGPGTVDRWLKEGTVTASDLSRIPYGETAEYLKRVKRNQNIYQWIYQLDDQLEEIKED